MNILYHHRTQGRGAEGVHITNIVIALQEMGHKVTVISPPGIDPLKTYGDKPVDKSHVKTSGVGTLWKLISKKLPNIMFEIAEVMYNFTAYLKLSGELKRGSYDIIYERYAFYLFVGAFLARKNNIKFVLEANEVNNLEERARKQSFKWLCYQFEKYIFSRCNKILTVSSYLKNMILEVNTVNCPVEIVPNAINIESVFNIQKDYELRKKYHISETDVLIGFGGWFDHWDKLDMLINVFAKIKIEFTQAKLMLIGDGPIVSDIKIMINNYNLNDDVILTGAVPRSEMFSYLKLLDIGILPHSNVFGSPIILFEMFGLRIPVVAPILPPITDVIIDGENGMLFKPLDENAMTIALIKMIKSENLRTIIADEAYVRLTNSHTWKHNATKIIT